MKKIIAIATIATAVVAAVFTFAASRTGVEEITFDTPLEITVDVKEYVMEGVEIVVPVKEIVMEGAEIVVPVKEIAMEGVEISVPVKEITMETVEVVVPSVQVAGQKADSSSKNI